MTARIVTDPLEVRQARAQPRSRKRDGRRAEVLAALLAGATIHFDDAVNHFNRKRFREVHGVLLRSSVDGVGGRYYWTEELPPDRQEAAA